MTVRELAFKYSTEGAAAAARADERVRRSVQRTGRAAQRNGASVQRWMERNRQAIRSVGLAAGAAVGTILAASPTMRAELGGVRAAFTLFADTIVQDVLPAGQSLSTMAVDLAQAYRDLPEGTRETISQIIAFTGVVLAAIAVITPFIISLATIAPTVVKIGSVLLTAGKIIGGFAAGLLSLKAILVALVAIIIAFQAAYLFNIGGMRDKTNQFLADIKQKGIMFLGRLKDRAIQFAIRMRAALINKINNARIRLAKLWQFIKMRAVQEFRALRARVLKQLSLGRQFAQKGKDMIGGWIQGVKSRASELIDEFGRMASDAAQRFITMFNRVLPDAINIPSRTFNIPDILGGGSVTVGGGSLDIPNIVPQLQTGGRIAREGLAMLHEGERVVPAAQVRDRGRQPVGDGDVRIERMVVQVGPRDDPRRQGQEIASEFEKQLENRGQ